MKFKSLTLAALLGILASATLAGPVLRSEVVVTAPIVTVGDLFEDAGDLAGKALFRSPAPGTAGSVSLEAVRQAASLVGLDGYAAEGVLHVRVSRAAAIVDAPLLTTLIVDDLRQRGIVADGIAVEAAFEQADLSFHAEAVDRPAQLLALRYTPANGAFTARFAIAGLETPVDVAGRIDLLVEAPHLATTLPSGAILALDDIEMKPIPLRQAESMGLPALDQLVGKQLTRQSRGGMLLRSSDVVEPRVVERNALVTVMLRHGPMTLTVKGQALNGAAAGQPVQVLNSVSRKILHGVALASGTVAVNATTTLNVAGL